MPALWFRRDSTIWLLASGEEGENALYITSIRVAESDVDVLYDALAWRLEPSGTWTKIPVSGEESQVKFQELAVARAKVRNPEA